MAISFKKLFNLMNSMHISSYKLTKKDKIIGSGTLCRMMDNDSVSTATINDLCNYLHCSPMDILEYIPDESDENALKN